MVNMFSKKKITENHIIHRHVAYFTHTINIRGTLLFKIKLNLLTGKDDKS